MNTSKPITRDAELTSGPVTPHDKHSPWPVFWVASVATFLVSLDTTIVRADRILTTRADSILTRGGSLSRVGLAVGKSTGSVAASSPFNR